MAKPKQPPVIVLNKLQKRFGIGDAEHFAIDGINLTIERGEFIAIMGPSGCGKTTLLNILGLLDNTIEGEYQLDGKPIESLSQRKKALIRSEQIGFVFQSFNLVSRLNVIDNVSLPLIYRGMTKLNRIKKASKILHDFHLGEREYYMPSQLSGGQMQRVAIARALVNEPSIILADEPTGNLDSHASHIIMEELSDLHQKGNTVIMVTHNPNLTTYASRVITMLDGKIDTDTFRLPLPARETAKRPLSNDTKPKKTVRKKIKEAKK
jgi:putative ABC transport system ATP-binding protein